MIKKKQPIKFSLNTLCNVDKPITAYMLMRNFKGMRFKLRLIIYSCIKLRDLYIKIKYRVSDPTKSFASITCKSKIILISFSLLHFHIACPKYFLPKLAILSSVVKFTKSQKIKGFVITPSAPPPIKNASECKIFCRWNCRHTLALMCLRVAWPENRGLMYC